MKKLLAAILIALFAMPALAGQNVRQNDDGGAVWVDGDGNTVPVGDTGIVIYIDDFGQATTQWVVTHKQGKVKKVYAIVNSGFTGDTELDFGLRPSGIAEEFNSVISPGNAAGVLGVTLGLTASGADGGETFTLDLSDGTNTSVTPGYGIYIHSNGGASTPVSGAVVIIVE